MRFFLLIDSKYSFGMSKRLKLCYITTSTKLSSKQPKSQPKEKKKNQGETEIDRETEINLKKNGKRKQWFPLEAVNNQHVVD